jgi:hypothetical protein
LTQGLSLPAWPSHGTGWLAHASGTARARARGCAVDAGGSGDEV